MRLLDEIKDDVREAKKKRLPWRVVLCWLAVCGLVLWLFHYLGRADLAAPTLISVGMLGCLIWLKGEKRRRVWFWMTVVGFAAVHVLLILSVPWPVPWPAGPVAVSGLGAVEFYVMLVVVDVVGRLVDGSSQSADPTHPRVHSSGETFR
jgi:hypothetical protein